MFREDSSNFAANGSVAKTSAETKSKEMSTFLRPSNETHDVVATAKTAKRVVKQKWSALKDVLVKDVVKNKSQRGKDQIRMTLKLLPEKERTLQSGGSLIWEGELTSALLRGRFLCISATVTIKKLDPGFLQFRFGHMHTRGKSLLRLLTALLTSSQPLLDAKNCTAVVMIWRSVCM